MRIFLFDTNVYRGLAHSLLEKPKNEVFLWISSLCNKELQLGYLKELNFWVVCELLKHLENTDDPSYKECELALRIAIEHCIHEGKLKLSMPIELEIVQYFQRDDLINEYENLYRNVISLCFEFLKNGRSSAFENFISHISQYIQSYQNILREGYTVSKKLLSKEELSQLTKDNYVSEVACRRILESIIINVSKINRNINENEVAFFFDKFYFGLARACILYRKDPSTKSFANHIIDAAICLRIGKEDDRVIVSDDGTGRKEGMISTFVVLNVYSEKALSNRDYFQMIDFDITR